MVLFETVLRRYSLFVSPVARMETLSWCLYTALESYRLIYVHL